VYTPIELREMRKMINCSFDKGGSCEGSMYHKNTIGYTFIQEGKGCCNFCKIRGGYFKYYETFGYEGCKKVYGWDEENGFWTPKGCRIPWHKRSWTCKTYVCDIVFYNMSSYKQNKYNRLFKKAHKKYWEKIEKEFFSTLNP